MPNYRVPITATTHESTCTRGCVSKGDSNKKLWIIAQKAGKQTTGYFAGYTVKRQPVGKYEMQQSAQSLNFLQAPIISCGLNPQIRVEKDSLFCIVNVWS